MSTKPLIFIYPLSDTMKKLKEAVEEISESEGVEIYEVDDLTEVAQLVPTIGQSLSIYGAPKKCAMALKQLRKVNAKLNSKVLLLSEKGIPRKTLDKFSKIGLTEFIQEPVAAKTLLYKVKLQLKSIVNDENGDENEGEVGVKKKGDEQVEDEESLFKSKSKSGQSEDDDEGLNYLTKKKKKSNFEIEEAPEKKKKNNYHEEEIDSHWQGKLTKEELSLDDVKEPKKEEKDENIIDNYLRGNTEKKEETLEEEEKERRNYKDEILHENLASNATREKMEDDYDIHKKKKEASLNIEENNNRSKGDFNSSDTHYRGTITKTEEEIEEAEEKKKKGLSVLEIEDNKEDIYLDEDEEHETRKKKKSLSILDIEDEGITQEKEEEQAEGKDYSEKKEKLLEEDSHKKGDSSVEHLDSEDESGEGSTDKIDMYLRGGAAKKEEEEREEDEDLYKRETLLSLDEEDLNDDINSNDEDEEANQKDKDFHLDIEDAQSKDKDIEEEREKHEEDDDHYERRKDTKLDLIDSDYKKNDESEEENDKNYRSTKGSLVKEEEDEDDKEKRKKEAELDFEKNKSHDSKVDDLTKKKLQADSKVDKIQTHYSSEASVSHIDDDWHFSKTKKNEQAEEERKNDDSLEMSYGEKLDLGEQTIDYRKLKDEFGGITIDRSGNKEKKQGPKYYGDGTGKKKKTPSYYRDDIENGSEQLEEQDENQEELEGEEIFEPNSKGLENIVRVLSFYDKTEKADEECYRFISKVIQEKFAGEVALFYYDERKSRVTEATNSLNLLNDLELEVKRPLWDKLFSKNYRDWKEMKLPTWSDPTFQDKNIHFIYPYYEGASLMGFSVSWFSKEFNEERCGELEVTLESLRGFVIAKFREGKNSGEYNGKAAKEEVKENPIKSFFGKFFGKKAS